MEHEQSRVEKFIWKVENFSRLKTDEVCSEPFVAGGYPWKICLYPKGDGVDGYLSIYLEAVKTANMSEEWSRVAKFKLLVLNQIDTNKTITEDFGDCEFNASESSWGFDTFIKLAKLRHPKRGFVVKDACIVGAEVYVCKSTHEKRLNQAANVTVSLTFGNPTSHMKREVPRPNPVVQDPNLETISPVSTLVCAEPTKHTDTELFSPSIEELTDFSRVELQEIRFVEHPSKRSCSFNNLAFSALGRVLYFLKTRKVKDMNDQAFEDLQVLWKELEKFRFDLTWLEPHVQFALGVKSYVEKVVQVEKLKENVVALELETDRLKAKLVADEVNIVKETDLLKAKGFEVRDLDSELGCWSWKP